MGPFIFFSSVFLYLLSPQNCVPFLISTAKMWMYCLTSMVCVFFSLRPDAGSDNQVRLQAEILVCIWGQHSFWLHLPSECPDSKVRNQNALMFYLLTNTSHSHQDTVLCFSVGRRPSGTWPFLTAGLGGPCWRGSAGSKLTFPFLSFMDHARTLTVSLDMRLRKPDQMWKSG